MKWLDFNFETMEDIKVLESLPLETLEKHFAELKIAVCEAERAPQMQERLRELKEIGAILGMIIMMKKQPPKEDLEKSADEMYLPEYRKEGYFNSEEFLKIEKEVDEFVSNIPGVTRQNFDTLKQKVLKDQYGIHWLPFTERFMPGVQVIID
ncbi:MAG: hypothetical protein IJ379_12055 [Lachnospiraceae bacterium]|nr:hypothetical protein [Lachnospiraceae bacterium]